MASQELIDYVNANLARGFTDDQIRQALIGAGHSELDVTDAIYQAQNVSEQPQKIEPIQKKKSHILVWVSVGLLSILILVSIYFIVMSAPFTKEMSNTLNNSVTNTESEQLTERNSSINSTPSGNSSAPSINCRIYANSLNIELAVGESKGLFVSGYAGSGDDVVWDIEDLMIGTLIPNKGSFSTITGTKEGTTRITVTDEAVGPDCQYRISVHVINS